jgi:hypothetical protein
MPIFYFRRPPQPMSAPLHSLTADMNHRIPSAASHAASRRLPKKRPMRRRPSHLHRARSSSPYSLPTTSRPAESAPTRMDRTPSPTATILIPFPPRKREHRPAHGPMSERNQGVGAPS